MSGRRKPWTPAAQARARQGAGWWSTRRTNCAPPAPNYSIRRHTSKEGTGADGGPIWRKCAPGFLVTSFSSCSAGDSVREWRGASAFCLHGLVVANPLLLHDQLAAHRLRAPRQGPCPLSLTLVSLHLDQTSSRAVPAIACAASILRSSLGPCRERPRRMVGRA